MTTMLVVSTDDGGVKVTPAHVHGCRCGQVTTFLPAGADDIAVAMQAAATTTVYSAGDRPVTCARCRALIVPDPRWFRTRQDMIDLLTTASRAVAVDTDDDLDDDALDD